MSECEGVDLKFDEMVVDTTLAEEYFRKKNRQFTCINYGCPIKDTNRSDFVLDQCDNRVYYSGDGGGHSAESKLNLCLGDVFWQLGMKIKENAELFCQLEYAVRNNPKDDVKKDIQLLINKCFHKSSLADKYNIKTKEIKCTHDVIHMAGDPLYYLCNAVSWLPYYVVIRAPPQAAAVCTLFTELCAQVGISWIALHLTKEEDLIPDYAVMEYKPWPPAEGCIGVVSETADLDSAVHEFVWSTTRYPWKLNVLLIQESVYDEFQKALQWKCNVNVSDEKPHEPHLKQLSADVQVASGKIFLIDYVGAGSIQSKLQPVLVSAYRTNKELLKIMSKYEEPFVSLWCSDSSQANEIAVSISSPFVWINSYAVFNGSPQITWSVPLHKKLITFGVHEKFKEIANPWLKLDVEKRREVTLEVLKTYIASNDDRKATKLQTILRTRRPGFVEVNKNDMWIGIEEPLGILYLRGQNTEYFLDAIASVVYGNRVVIRPDVGNSLIEQLQEAGLPILEDILDLPSEYTIYDIRSIYSNFGTIFAN